MLNLESEKTKILLFFISNEKSFELVEFNEIIIVCYDFYTIVDFICFTSFDKEYTNYG